MSRPTPSADDVLTESRIYKIRRTLLPETLKHAHGGAPFWRERILGAATADPFETFENLPLQEHFRALIGASPDAVVQRPVVVQLHNIAHGLPAGQN